MATSLNFNNNNNTDGNGNGQENHHDNVDWRRRRTTIHERLLCYLTFNESREGDVLCILGSNDNNNNNGQRQQLRLKTFKVLLVAQSKIFHKMFEECHTNSPSTVQFASMERDGQGGYIFRDSDVVPRAFQTFRKMLLKDDATMMNYMTNNRSIYWTVKQVLDLLYIAKKFAVYALSEACETFLKQNLSSQNVLQFFDKIHIFSHDLKQTTVNLLCSNINRVLNMENIVNLSKESLSEILSSEKLLLKETKLFDYLCRWAEFQCVQKKLEKTDKNMREICGTLLLKIRFPLMSLGEFDKLKYKNMLTATEALELFKYIFSSTSNKNGTELQRRGFNILPRGVQNSCLQIISSSSRYSQTRSEIPRPSPGPPNSSTGTTTSATETTMTNSSSCSKSSSLSNEELIWNEWEPQIFYIQDPGQDVSDVETYVCAGDSHFLEIKCEKRIKVESLGFFGSASTSAGQWYNVYTEHGNPPQKKNQRIDASHTELFRVPLNPPAIVEPNTIYRIIFSIEGENPLHRSRLEPNESDLPPECMQIYGGGVISFRHDAVALANIKYKVALQ